MNISRGCNFCDQSFSGTAKDYIKWDLQHTSECPGFISVVGYIPKENPRT